METSPAPAAAPTSEPAPAFEPVSGLTRAGETGARKKAPQLIVASASLDDPESPPTTADDDLAAAATRLVDDLLESFVSASGRDAALIEQAGNLESDLVEAMGGTLGALMWGGAEGTPEPAKQLFGQVADVRGDVVRALGQAFDELPGGGGNPKPAGLLIEQDADVAVNLTQAFGQALGALFGAGEASDPADTPTAQHLGALTERIAALIGRTTDAVGHLERGAAGGALVDASEAPSQSGSPAAPPAVPPEVPVAPGGPAPASYSSFVSASGSSTDAFQLLFAVLLAFSIPLLRGGKLSNHRKALGPHSAPTLAIEQPG